MRIIAVGMGYVRLSNLMLLAQYNNVIGADINTVSPPHDVSGMTAFLAATVGLEILSLICHSKGLVK